MTRKDHFDLIRQRGRRAFLDGEARKDNPYPDKRKDDGRITFSRAYRNAWDRGWMDEKGRAT